MKTREEVEGKPDQETCRKVRQQVTFSTISLFTWKKKITPQNLSLRGFPWFSNLAKSLIQVNLMILTTTLGGSLKAKANKILPSRSQLSMPLTLPHSNPGSQSLNKVGNQFPKATKSHCFKPNFTWVGLYSRRSQGQVVCVANVFTYNNHHALYPCNSSAFLRAFQQHLIIS